MIFKIAPCSLRLRQSLKTSVLASHFATLLPVFSRWFGDIVTFCAVLSEGVNIYIDLQIGIRSTYKLKVSVVLILTIGLSSPPKH